jgi:hypothetical protein
MSGQTQNAMTKNPSPDKLEWLRAELTKVRHQSLLATRQNDYRKIAQLTAQAARLNRELREVTLLS